MSGGRNQREREREENRASSKWAEDVIRETGKGSAVQCRGNIHKGPEALIRRKFLGLLETRGFLLPHKWRGP